MSTNNWLIPRYELEGRNFGLDLFRCLAVLCVLTAHTLLLFSKQPLFQVIIAYLGVYGVELFFVLSGFLIGTILIKINNRDTYTSFTSIKSFWIRRWFRTLPNYFLVFVVYFVVFKMYTLYIPYRKLLLYFVFLQNAFSHNQWFYAVSWSLSVEEWFYLTFPLVLLAAQHFINKSKLSNILYAIVFFLVVCLAIRIVAALHFHNQWDESFRKQMPMRLDSIAIGVMAALLKFYYPMIWGSNKKKLFAAGFVIVVALSTFMYFDMLNTGNLYGNFFMNTFFFTFFSVGCAMLLPGIYALKIKRLGIIGYAVTYISLISYSVYLIHPLLGYVIPFYLPEATHGVLDFTLIWASTLVVASLIYNLYEKRMTALRDNRTTENVSVDVSVK